MANPPKKIYGLIGFPVKHSLSPAMHNAAFRELGIPAEYRLFEIEPSKLEGFFNNNLIPDINGNNIRLRELSGFNVTIPHKVKILELIGATTGYKSDDSVNLVDAVNTVKVYSDHLEAFNTDGEGFWRHLTKYLKFEIAGKTVAIIGAGGASRAISAYLCLHKAKTISIFDIKNGRLEMLVDNLQGMFNGDDVDIRKAYSIEDLDIANCDLLVNATPIGMKEDDPCLVDEKLIHRNLLVYDLIYNPKQTKLLKVAQEKGAQVSNGLGMLLYQGAAAFEIWIGRQAPVDVMREALLKEIK